MEPEENDKIAKMMSDLLSNDLTCPMCGSSEFKLLNQYGRLLALESLKITFQKPTQINSVILGCQKCGFLSMHATVPLGLSKPKKRETNS